MAKIMLCVILSVTALVCPNVKAEVRARVAPKAKPSSSVVGQKRKLTPEQQLKLNQLRRKRILDRVDGLIQRELRGEKIVEQLDKLLNVKDRSKPLPSPSPVMKVNLTLGSQIPVGGFSPVQPSFGVSLSDGSNFALGLAAHILKGYVGQAAMGAMGVTANIQYYSSEAFSTGWFGQFGIGLYGVHAKMNSLGIDWNFKFKSPVLYSLGGYRYKFNEQMSVGVGGGVLYMGRWDSVRGSNFEGVKPMISIDFGYALPF